MSKLEQIKSLAKRRGFFWPSCEIYGKTAGLWNYGPLGAALKRNIINEWRNEIVKKDRMFEVDGTILMPSDVFKSSGHLKNFQDPLVECKKCKSVFRVDKLIEKKSGNIIPEALLEKEFDNLVEKYDVVCPNCGGPLSNTKMFNLMIKSPLGAKHDEETYLRPETCQTIFVDFLQVYRAMRGKLPIGIAQVGKSFRNEISPRQTILRTREFTQAEIEVFFDPENESRFEKYKIVKDFKLNLFFKGKMERMTCEDAINKKILHGKIEAYYLSRIVEYFKALGFSDKEMRLREIEKNERPFYAKSAWDLEIKTSLGWIEVVANHNRSDHDLSSHAKISGKDLSVIDGNKKVLPWVWESSMGIDRVIYCVLDKAYDEDEIEGEKRIVLRIPPKLAPYKVAVFPLVKRDGLKEKAEKVFSKLEKYFPAFFDVSGSIGRRYRRMDEIGTPFCITIDYQTLEDDTVTVRDRDTTKQERIKISDLVKFICERVM